MSCKCQNCGNEYYIDLMILDDFWEIIKPKGKPQGAGLLCGSCIMKRLEEFKKYGAYELRDLI
jgi:hypothetical protein